MLEHTTGGDDAPEPCDEIFVNVQSLLHGQVSPWLKTAALRATRYPSGGFSIGTYLNTLSDEHMADILEAARAGHNGDSSADIELKLLALMLANGEAMPVSGDHNMSELAGKMLLLVQAEYWRRKRMIDFNPLLLSLDTLDHAGLQLTRQGTTLVLQARRR